jgi:hypothetical protein
MRSARPLAGCAAMCRGTKLAFVWPALIIGALAFSPASDRSLLVAAPLRPPADDPNLRTFRFSARVAKNGGVTPFEVGTVVKGTITYDLRGKDRLTENFECGKYDSERNALSLRLGDLEFKGVGKVVASASAFGHAESVSVIAPDLVLPSGWAMEHGSRSQSYGVILQNAPPRDVLAGKKLPDKVQLADFKDTRELRLDFSDGIKFPGGEVKGRATVHCKIEELEEVNRGGR